MTDVTHAGETFRGSPGVGNWYQDRRHRQAAKSERVHGEKIPATLTRSAGGFPRALSISVTPRNRVFATRRGVFRRRSSHRHRMNEENRPEVEAQLEDSDRFGEFSRIVVTCPFCGDEHRHGLTDDLRDGRSSPRAADCSGSGGYDVVLSEQSRQKLEGES